VSNYKNLIVFLGNARGGEKTWATFYKHLLAPFNADLALLFGFTENKTSSLYSKAKYVWEFNEFENWGEYYKQNNFLNILNLIKFWKGEGLAGGIDDCQGSGAVIFALRHMLLSNYKDILQQYDRIILTRSDFYYIDDHPDVDINRFHITEGEDHMGLGDRHHIFNKDMIENALSILPFLENNLEKYAPAVENRTNPPPLCNPSFRINPEVALKLFFESNGMIELLNRCKRVQFTVKLPDDQTRWSSGFKWNDNEELLLKYPAEYELAMHNKNL